ncbi:MAG TPA: class I SAM-dependent methyltransferase [Solimonas sp.]|nr:class I SAM-dependent methyltransferase [Solimonas sp.]
MQSKLDAALSHQQARQAYGLLAGVLSVATRYEALATRRMIEHARFGSARSVFEFGCGTGHFGNELLTHHLPADARYTGVDLTPRMIALSRKRLARFGVRAKLHQSDGGPPADEQARSHDRFVSNFVLDLLPEVEIEAVLAAAHRMLADDGLLCLASLAPGRGFASRRIMRVWEAIYRVTPAVVGGCRPLQLRTLLPDSRWRVLHNEVVGPLGIPLEVVVAAKG